MKRIYPTILLAITLGQSGCAMVKDLITQEPSTPFDDPFSHTASAPDRFEEEMANVEAQRAEELDAAYIQAQQIARARRQREIVLGMSPEDVRNVWGQPRDVETAGDPGQGNQRWTYYEGLSSRYGLSSARVIYFENGRVAGWETR